MRPDVIDWSSTSQSVGVAIAPRQRLPRQIARWFFATVIVQTVLTLFLVFLFTEPSLTHVLEFPWGKFGAAAAGGGLITAAVMFLSVRKTVRRCTTGLRRLHEALRDFGTLPVVKAIPVVGEGELAFLSMAFNDMAGRLLQSRRALIELNEELEQRVAARTGELAAVNAELDEKNVRLAELTDAALRFTDDVAHEFRTPLTVIQEYASLVMDGLGGPVTESQTEYLGCISTATSELACLVDDFLDSSRIRAGNIRVDRRAYTVEDILQSCWRLLQARAADDKIVLEQHIDPDVPMIRADMDKARRSLINLVVNAIKFSGSGKTVRVCCRRLPSGLAEIAVTDQGPGLAPEELDALFTRFKQGLQGHRSAAKGFGLGLSIVRDMVWLNLGTVSIASKVGKGSTFAFTLPPDEPAAFISAFVEHMRANDVSQLTVMVVDAPATAGEAQPLETILSNVLPTNAVCYPLRNGTRMLVIGAFANAAAWIASLGQPPAAFGIRRNASADQHIHVDTLGTFSLEDAVRVATDQIVPSLEKEGCTIA